MIFFLYSKIVCTAVYNICTLQVAFVFYSFVLHFFFFPNENKKILENKTNRGMDKCQNINTKHEKTEDTSHTHART